MKQLVVIAHNIRSTHNIGAIFRSCDGFGAQHIYITGYSPYPALPNDPRLPHESAKLTKQIAKTALGAEKVMPFSYEESPQKVLAELKKTGYQIVALEQTDDSIFLQDFTTSNEKIALLLGEERYGITDDLLAQTDVALEIPMQGSKESFNVSVACGIALYQLSLL